MSVEIGAIIGSVCSILCFYEYWLRTFAVGLGVDVFFRGLIGDRAVT
jgi:hypothetical protein